jgi:hypothetical protein
MLAVRLTRKRQSNDAEELRIGLADQREGRGDGSCEVVHPRVNVIVKAAAVGSSTSEL